MNVSHRASIVVSSVRECNSTRLWRCCASVCFAPRHLSIRLCQLSMAARSSSGKRPANRCYRSSRADIGSTRTATSVVPYRARICHRGSLSVRKYSQPIVSSTGRRSVCLCVPWNILLSTSDNDKTIFDSINEERPHFLDGTYNYRGGNVVRVFRDM